MRAGWRPGTRTRISGSRLRLVAPVALSLLSVLVLAPAAAGDVVAVGVAADAYVDESSPKRKFGTATDLLAGSLPNRRGYVRFSVSGLSTPVVRATLRLNAAAASLSGYEVHPVADNSWSERTITASNAPAVGVGVVAASGAIAGGPTSTDVTQLVTGNGDLTIALTSVSTTPVSLASREAGISGPQLLIETRDVTAPSVTLAVPANGSSTNVQAPIFSGAAGTATGDNSAVTVAVYAGSAPSGTPVQTLNAARSGGSWSVAAGAPLASGTYTAQAKQADDSGNVGVSSANTFTVDTAPPAVTLESPTDGALTSSRMPALAGSAGTAPGDSGTITVRLYGGSSATGPPFQTIGVARSGSSWAAAPASLSDGTYTARAEQTDAAGNVGRSADHTFTVDSSPPAVTLTQPASGSTTSTSRPTFSGAAGTAMGDAGDILVHIYPGTAATGTPAQSLQTMASGGSWSVDAAAALADGTYTARAEQTDAAGNVGKSAPSTFGVGTAPPPSADYRAAVLGDAPRAYWRLGETAGLSAADESSNRIAGIYLNGVALGRPGALSGEANTAIGLDGVDDTVRVPNVAALNSSAAMSLESWVNFGALPSSASLARKEGQYLLRLMSSGSLVFRLWKGGGITELATADASVSANAWHHLVATWDGATMRLFVDGTVRASRPLAAPGNVSANDLYLGSSYDSYDRYSGSLDEVAVYGGALSESRVRAHYTTGNPTGGGPEVSMPAPANGSTADATPNFGGKGGTALGDAGTVTVKVYSGSVAVGTPVQTRAASLSSAGTFSVRAAALASGTYTAVAEQADSGGTVGRSPQTTFTVDAGADPVLVAAGDVAACDTFGDEATAAVLDRLPGTVVPVGDLVYEDGTARDFADCYDPTWGRHKARTRPVVGGHEYRTPGAAPYYDYFGAAAGDPSTGYYSYDVGGWHVIALNDVCTEIGGCGPGSPEEQWLRADLSAHPARCTVAFLHTPRFSSGSIHGSSTAMQPLWQALYDAGAELVVSAHDHIYERFAAQTPAGSADPARGIREIIAGTGGRSHYAIGTVKANSEVRNTDAFGLLKLTLHGDGYDWQFVPEAGRAFTDAGSGSCH